jgi:hypothetical protein
VPQSWTARLMDPINILLIILLVLVVIYVAKRVL